MTIPSGPGSEVLCRGTFETQSNSLSAAVWTSPYRATVGTATATVPAHNIITILNIIVMETSGSADEKLHCYFHDGTGNIELFVADIPAQSTFVFNDKMILMPGDKLNMNLFSAGNVDIMINFIRQDWT